MITYKVKKCRHGRCMCHLTKAPWRVIRVNGPEQRIMSRWPGHGMALEAAIEYAGLVSPNAPLKPMMPLHLLVTKAPAC